MPTTPNKEASMTRKPPSSKQLTYLKALANRTGQTFTYPKTSLQASGEIQRLKSIRPSSASELAMERFDLAAENAARDANCDATIRSDEIAGWGSNAHWSQRS
jgi:hypothetical protein